MKILLLFNKKKIQIVAELSDVRYQLQMDHQNSSSNKIIREAQLQTVDLITYF